MPDLSVHFVERQGGPERLVCDAEIHFRGDHLDGLKLVGFSLWRSAEGDVFVSFPSRPFGSGGERRYFDLVRSIDGTREPGRRLKAEILRCYEAHMIEPPEGWGRIEAGGSR